MKTLFLLLLGGLMFWGFQENVHEDLKSLYEDKGNETAWNRHLTVIDSKACGLFNDLFSGCNISKTNFNCNFALPLDLTAHVNSITKNAVSHDKKIKAIYEWITHHIAYDTDYNIYSADLCYLEGKGVCNAYSLLMVKMLDCAGIRAVKVNGKAKSGKDDDWEGHAWVLVEKGDGSFMLCDPTWDAGSVDSVSGKFHHHPSLEWYDVEPALMILSHVPNAERHRLL